MEKILAILLQCGALIVIPGISFGFGLWLIVRYVGFKHKMGTFFFAVLMGIVLFEASFIGMAIDPRSNINDLGKITLIAGIIGVGTILIIPIFTTFYVNIINKLKD